MKHFCKLFCTRIIVKQLMLAFSLLALHCVAGAQDADPVHWSYQAEKIGDKTYRVRITGAMDEGWHIYAGEQPKEAISAPTKITFTKNPLITPTGKLQEVGNKQLQELSVAGIKQYYYAGKVDFMQVITLKGKAKTALTGTIHYQVCTDKMCLPEKDMPFRIAIP